MKTISKEEAMKKLGNQIHITKHTGKMECINSASTACTMNPFCQERSKDKNSICYKCYSKNYLNYRKSLRVCLERNTLILTQSIIPWDDLPRIYDRFFRFESFGDLINATHFINFIRIAQKNPETNFALWTKNIEIVNSVLDSGEFDKPENLFIVYSSRDLNKKEDLSLFPHADKVFTVYDKEHAKDVNINCGKRKCIECRLCYTKNKVTEISELVK